jgi:hypothetical protein
MVSRITTLGMTCAHSDLGLIVTWLSATRSQNTWTKRHATAYCPWPCSIPLARDLVIDADIDTKLFPEDLSERAAISQIYPVSDTTTFFLTHAFLGHDPVETLGSRYGRAEPDLLVRGLLVQDECVALGRDFEDASLFVVKD